jgi:hypothetical protein
MFKKIIIILSALAGTSAFAGIIGTGGVNANENPDLMRALEVAESVEVSVRDFHRLAMRIGEQGIVNAEITSTSGERIRSDFVKVFVDGEGRIVDREVTKVLDPKYP